MARPGYLTMREVCRLTGLTERQVRYYDQRGLVVAERTPGGHRLYRHAHVQRLLRVKGLLAAGLTLGEARERMEAEAAPAARADHHPSPVDYEPENVKIYFRSLRRPQNDRR